MREKITGVAVEARERQTASRVTNKLTEGAVKETTGSFSKEIGVGEQTKESNKHGLQEAGKIGCDWLCLLQ